jgi:hypothetical protein
LPAISAENRAVPSGTPFAIPAGMSPIGRALQDRFEEVCRAELQRLHKKTASLSEEERAEVDAITVQVTQAIVARVEAALEHQQADDLAAIVARLFAVSPTGSGRERLGCA